MVETCETEEVAPICKNCGCKLTVGVNWATSRKLNSTFTCSPCASAKEKELRFSTPERHEKFKKYKREYAARPGRRELAEAGRRTWIENNKELSKERARRNALKRMYGITLEDYYVILNKQEGVCAICGAIPDEKHGILHVDHCHSSGTVRGLLCKKCNMALGLFNDNLELLKTAIMYLKEGP